MRQLICPVCKSLPTSHTTHFELVLCQNCSVTWLYLKEDIDTDALYEDEVYQVVDNRKSIFERIIFSEAKTVLKTVKKLITARTPFVLDFGSGKGLFLEQVRLMGWTPYGVETSKPRAAFAEKFYGVPISTQIYNSGKIAGGSFDVISLFHVLEHLPEPLVLLDNLIKDNLAKEGIVVIEVPNFKSWQATIAGNDWMHLDLPRHLSHWNEKSLTQKLGEIGLKKVKSQYFSIHLGVLGMLRSIMGLTGYKGNIIYDLKNRRKPAILFQISVILPLAFILESLSVPFKRSGIIRLYFKNA